MDTVFLDQYLPRYIANCPAQMLPLGRYRQKHRSSVDPQSSALVQARSGGWLAGYKLSALVFRTTAPAVSGPDSKYFLLWTRGVGGYGCCPLVLVAMQAKHRELLQRRGTCQQATTFSPECILESAAGIRWLAQPMPEWLDSYRLLWLAETDIGDVGTGDVDESLATAARRVLSIKYKRGLTPSSQESLIDHLIYPHHNLGILFSESNFSITSSTPPTTFFSK